MELIHGVSCIKGEIHSIITLMRLNTRWSTNKTFMRPTRDSFFGEEEPLIENFRKLNTYLEGVCDLQDVDSVTYVLPFHNLIVSEQAGSSLTSAALSSLSKFALYGFFAPHYPRIKEAMSLIAKSISHCVFEETDWESDELILMKLLELSTLCYRCQASVLLSAESAWDVFSTCKSIHEHYRASKILKNEAESALVHLTLNVFSRASHMALKFGITKEIFLNTVDKKACFLADVQGITLILLNIVKTISSMMEQNAESVKMALTLINVALEAGGLTLSSIDPLVDALCNDICRHLLRITQSDDLAIFSCALRVVFNLFMSMKDNMKVQLEVFLTSVHLRVLNGSNAQAREELTLESLLEFCREPSLIQDLYINYDCDVRCTNLFDSIVHVLCKRSTLNIVRKSASADSEGPVAYSEKKSSPSNRITIIHRLAFEGLVAILHGMAAKAEKSISQRRESPESCGTAENFVCLPLPVTEGEDVMESEIDKWCEDMSDTDLLSHDETDIYHVYGVGSQVRGAVLPVTPGGRSSSRPDAVRRGHSGQPFSVSHASSPSQAWMRVGGEDSSDHSLDGTSSIFGRERNNSETSLSILVDRENEITHSMIERVKRAEVLRKRKVMKQRLKSIAESFNAKPLKNDWLQAACDVGLVHRLTVPPSSADTTSADSNPIMADPKSVAEFLKTSPGLGKQQVGEFISKGPAHLFPFHASVLHAYVRTFNYRIGEDIMSFDQALRSFLSSFRLPGEAQCIDRIMEAFAGSYYEQLGPGQPFASADAVFILSFSTIMLNTDLHNPGIPANKKMTKEQFIRNNRDINDGKDLPREYLENLYDQIKESQIQVHIDVTDSKAVVDFADPAAWQKLISRISQDQAPADFTPTASARLLKKKLAHDGFGDSLWDPLTYNGDMFVTMSKPVYQSIFLLWDNINDDLFLRRVLQASADFLLVSRDMELNELVNSVVQVFVDCSWQYMVQLRKIRLRSYSKLNVLIHRATYEQWRSENGSDLTALLVRESEELLLDTCPNELWSDATLVKGELTVRLLFNFVLQHRRTIRADCWSTIFAFMLWSRSRASLPKESATISNVFRLKTDSEASTLERLMSNDMDEKAEEGSPVDVRFSASVFAKRKFLSSDRIESGVISPIILGTSNRLPRQLSSVYVEASSPPSRASSLANGSSNTANGGGSWFPTFLWSGGSSNANSEGDTLSLQNVDQKIQSLSFGEEDFIFGNCNDFARCDSEGNHKRTDDWLLQIALENAHLMDLLGPTPNTSKNESEELSQRSTGSVLEYRRHHQAHFDGLVITLENILRQLTQNAIISLRPTAQDRSSNKISAIVEPSSLATVSGMLPVGDVEDVAESADNSQQVPLEELFPTQMLKPSLDVAYSELDAILCLEWLSNLVNDHVLHWKAFEQQLLELLTLLLREEVEILMKQYPLFLERCVVVSVRCILSYVHYDSSTSKAREAMDPLDATGKACTSAWRLLHWVLDLPSDITHQLAGVLSAGAFAIVRAVYQEKYHMTTEMWREVISLLTTCIFAREGQSHAMQTLAFVIKFMISNLNYQAVRLLALQLVTYRLAEGANSKDWNEQETVQILVDMKQLLKLTLTTMASLEARHASRGSKLNSGQLSPPSSPLKERNAGNTPNIVGSQSAPRTPQTTSITPSIPVPVTNEEDPCRSVTSETLTTATFQGLRSSAMTAAISTVASKRPVIGHQITVPVVHELETCFREEEIEQLWLATAIVYADWTGASNVEVAETAMQALELLVCAAEKALVSPSLLFVLFEEMLTRLPLQVSAQNARLLPVSLHAASLVVHMIVINISSWRLQVERFNTFFVRLVTGLAGNLRVVHQIMQYYQQSHQANSTTSSSGSTAAKPGADVSTDDILSLIGTLFRLLKLPSGLPEHVSESTANRVEDASAAQQTGATISGQQSTGGLVGMFSYINPLSYMFTAAPLPPNPPTAKTSDSNDAINKVATSSSPGPPLPTPASTVHLGSPSDILLAAVAYKSAMSLNPALPAMIRQWDSVLFRALQESLRFKDTPISQSVPQSAGDSASRNSVSSGNVSLSSPVAAVSAPSTARTSSQTQKNQQLSSSTTQPESASGTTSSPALAPSQIRAVSIASTTSQSVPVGHEKSLTIAQLKMQQQQQLLMQQQRLRYPVTTAASSPPRGGGNSGKKGGTAPKGFQSPVQIV